MTRPLILLRATLREGREEDFDNLLNRILPETRLQDGCVAISAFRKADGSRRIILAEQWQTLDHYKRYVAWRDSTGDLAELIDLLEAPPEAEIWPELLA